MTTTHRDGASEWKDSAKSVWIKEEAETQKRNKFEQITNTNNIDTNSTNTNNTNMYKWQLERSGQISLDQ